MNEFSRCFPLYSFLSSSMPAPTESCVYFSQKEPERKICEKFTRSKKEEEEEN